MKLEKFPVTSKNGSEYLVTISKSNLLYSDQVEVALYKKLGKKTIFGREKVKSLNKDIMGNTPIYREEEWNYDYKAMAIKEVENYEYEQKLNQLIKENRENGTKQFNNWDGIVE